MPNPIPEGEERAVRRDFEFIYCPHVPPNMIVSVPPGFVCPLCEAEAAHD